MANKNFIIEERGYVPKEIIERMKRKREQKAKNEERRKRNERDGY